MREQRLLHLVLVLLTLWLPATTSYPDFHAPAEDPAELELCYHAYNEQYFDNALPQNVIVYWDTMEGSALGAVAFDPGTGQFVVRLSMHLQFSETLTRMVLLHEMVHIKLWNASRGHGMPFQEEVLVLAHRGAFDGLW